MKSSEYVVVFWTLASYLQGCTMPCTWDKVVMKSRKFTRVLPVFHPSTTPRWTIPECCEEWLFFFYEHLNTFLCKLCFKGVCVCVMSFLAIVKARSDMGPSSQVSAAWYWLWQGVTIPQLYKHGDRWLGICRAKGGRQSLALDRSQWKAIMSLYCKCVWHQKAPFPLEFFLWVVKLHTFCVVFTKKSIGKEHFRKHSGLSRFLDTVAVILFMILCLMHLSCRPWTFVCDVGVCDCFC